MIGQHLVRTEDLLTKFATRVLPVMIFKVVSRSEARANGARNESATFVMLKKRSFVLLIYLTNVATNVRSRQVRLTLLFCGKAFLTKKAHWMTLLVFR